MKTTRHAAGLALMLCIGVPAVAMAATETYQSSLIHFTLPTGWVKFRPGNGVLMWAAADDPAGARCVVSMELTEFDADPNQSFLRGWKKLPFTRRPGVVTPTPTITPLKGGYTVGHGAWSGRLPSGETYFVALGNVSRAKAGHLLVAKGSAPGCGDTFAKLLKTIEVVDQDAVSPSASGGGTPSMADSMRTFNDGLNQTEQRQAAQRRQDQQQADRQADQRAVERQNQARQAQQRELDRQNQQRIQDSYRR